jgi:hypothetical protein
LYEVVFDTKRDDTDQYLEKYPHALKVAKKDPRFKNYFEGKRNGVIAVGIVRHEKAKKLLFKILEQRIEHWWD